MPRLVGKWSLEEWVAETLGEDAGWADLDGWGFCWI